MPDVKRLNYFTGQFLRETDFQTEQQYHLRHVRDHQHFLHTPGIADGLDVSDSIGASDITVRKGVAYDDQGRRLALEEDFLLDLTDAADDLPLWITISSVEQASEPTSETGVTGNTRISERVSVEHLAAAPPNPTQKLVVARVERSGRTVSKIDRSERRIAGIKGGDLVVRTLTVTSADNVPEASRLRLALGAAGRGDVMGSLRLSGSLEVAGSASIAGRDVNTELSKLAERFDPAKGHNHDGTNSRKLTPADVGALPSAGGTLSGGLTLQAGNLAVSAGTLTVSGALTANGAAQAASLTVSGGTTLSTLRVGGATGLVTVGASTAATFPYMQIGNPLLQTVALYITDTAGNIGGTSDKSAVLIDPKNSNSVGLTINAANGTNSLLVRGTSKFDGPKSGYVVDTFVNGGTEVLRTGDIVKLKSTGSVSFYGDNNRIPIGEVVLADTDDDPLVMGIVAQEATPNADEPDDRTDPGDPTSIPPGGKAFVVTLGAFAHCKVDARKADIAVGDLLTTSSNRGCAKKAAPSKVGAIIGKALEPLQGQVGYIAVFANIQ